MKKKMRRRIEYIQKKKKREQELEDKKTDYRLLSNEDKARIEASLSNAEF